MVGSPRIPELAQRDRFVRRAVAEGRVLTVADEEHACVPSQKSKGRTVQLFWSSTTEAQRWAQALSGSTDLQEIALATFVADILPGLAGARGLAGTDWVSDPIEAEVDPHDLQIRLKAEAMPGYATALVLRGEAYFLIDGAGPVLQPSMREGQPETLQIFTSRAEAERKARSSAGVEVVADTVANLASVTLGWAGAKGYALLLEPIVGGGPAEVRPEDLRRLLALAYPGAIEAEDGSAAPDGGVSKRQRP